MAKHDPLDDFQVSSFEHEGVSRDVYQKGQGPGVIIMHEIPGITPAVAGFARRVVDSGFRVYMPNMFGVPGKPRNPAYVVGTLARACVRHEFLVLATRGSSPITIWLRALCREAHAECGGRGVGAVGMCLTGNFALSLMVDDSVMAPVLSQPSLPFGITPAQKAAVHLSDEELQTVKTRSKSQNIPVIGLRFTHDLSCPAARFDTLREVFEERFEAHEIDSGPKNRWGHPRWAHSVLTEDLIDEDGQPSQHALHRVLEFFSEQLRQN